MNSNMKRILNLILLFTLFLPLSAMADDGKVCPVDGGSVQAEVTNSPTRVSEDGTWGYHVKFVLMNSSPNWVNATYVIKDTKGNNYASGRVLVPAQKETAAKDVFVKTSTSGLTFVVDVIGADCKEK